MNKLNQNQNDFDKVYCRSTIPCLNKIILVVWDLLLRDGQT